MAIFTADMAAVDDGQQQQVDTTIDAGDQGQQVTGDEGQQQQVPNVDGRRGPMDIRTAAKSIAEALADPTNDLAAKFPGQEKAVKAITDGYFRADAYANVFPKVEDAQAAKTLFDGVGGVEGVSKLMERGQQYDAQDEGLRSGDPAVLDQAFKDFPEGMATLAPHYLDRLAKSNPEAFENTMAPHAMGLLDRAGIPAHIAEMSQRMDGETDAQYFGRLQRAAGQLNQWVKKNSETIKQTRQQAVAPQDTKFKEQQTKLHQEQDAFFVKQVDDSMSSAVRPDLTKVVDQYAKTHGLNEVQTAQFGNSLAQRMVDEMVADATFRQQDDIRKRSKDVAKVAEFRASEFKRRLDDTAFKHWNETKALYGKTTAAQRTGEVKPGGAKSAPGGGPLMVSRALDTADLDMTKDPNGYLFIANKGYRKADGAFVTWK